MIKNLAGHSLDTDLLWKERLPMILDIGCRGTGFKAALKDALSLYSAGISPMIIGVDPDENVAGAMHVAIVGSGPATQTYARFSTGEGNHLGSGYGIPDCSPIDVPCMTVAGLSRVFEVKHWDAVKLDCEGSEFSILENWPGPIATQISVEFHDHLNPKRWNDEYFRWLFSQLPDYEVVQHEASIQGDQRGHWDSLLILKGSK